MKISISIVIPAFNEELRILDSILSIQNYLKNDDYEIIVCDDGSTDKTREICKEVGGVILNAKRKNLGKGYSVKEGVNIASKEYILITDADLSTPIEEFDKLFRYAENNVVVIGSRALRESVVRNVWIRKIAGGLGNTLIQSLVKGIKDTQCGFKLFHAEAANKIFNQQKLYGFGYDFEVLFLARSMKFIIMEVPVIWNNVDGSKVKPIDYLKVLYELISVHINRITRAYDVNR